MCLVSILIWTGDRLIPLVKVQRGKCEIEVVLKDILGLTKINFNTCLNNDRLPVTIRFANEVGDVLIAAPIESEPRLPFKFISETVLNGFFL